MTCHTTRVKAPPRCSITDKEIDFDNSSWSLAKQALEEERRKARKAVQNEFNFHLPTLGSAYTITPAEKAKRDAERAEEILRVRQSHDEWLDRDGKVEPPIDMALLFNLLLKTLLWCAIGILLLMLVLIGPGMFPILCFWLGE